MVRMINEVIDCIENSQAKAAEKKAQEQQEESQTLLDKRQSVLIVCLYIFHIIHVINQTTTGIKFQTTTSMLA